MYKKKLYRLLLQIFLSFVFFIFLSLYISAQKILIVCAVSLIFLLIKFNYKKIILINLIFFTLLLKISVISFQKKNFSIDPSRAVIYEKHFLYGVKNLNITYETVNGDLSSLEKNLKEKYAKLNKKKKINIITDNLGFRNKMKPKKADYIFVGDSFLQLGNLSQENILNYVLNNSFDIKIYNAGVGATDISHYFETIKFFKDKLDLKNKKYVMLIFQGNDFLDYKIVKKNNYHKYINNNVLHNYFKFKIFFNFYPLIKYLLHSVEKNDEEIKKVYEYKVKNNDMLFKFDYIYKDGHKVSSLNNIFKQYKGYLPDTIIFIPTKYEVYCELINNTNCAESKHFSVLKNESLLSKVKVFNSKDFLIDKAKQLINTKDEFIYDVDDTHLNKKGIIYLSEFISSALKE